MSETLRDLIIARHGEGEGDVRRAAWRRGEMVAATKMPEREEITAQGIWQSRQAGLWIQDNVVAARGLAAFDGCYVSSARRSEQTTAALGLPIAVWQRDNCLDERNRGKIRGLTPGQHRQLYPQSFEQMISDPLHWVPPEGESVLEVAERARQFLHNIEGARTVLAVTHRDWMWAAQLILEHLTEAELLAVNTDAIGNACVLWYTSINPETGEQADGLRWRRLIDPTSLETDSGWLPIHAM